MPFKSFPEIHLLGELNFKADLRLQMYESDCAKTTSRWTNAAMIFDLVSIRVRFVMYKIRWVQYAEKKYLKMKWRNRISFRVPVNFKLIYWNLKIKLLLDVFMSTIITSTVGCRCLCMKWNQKIFVRAWNLIRNRAQHMYVSISSATWS